MESFKNTTIHSVNEKKNTDSGTDKVEKNNSVEKLPKPVYYIESPNDDTVLIGIGVTIEHSKMNEENISRISWYDTTRERVMVASEAKQKNDFFAFKRIDQEGGGYYYFMPMDLKVYNDKVKQHLAAGADFTNDNDLIKAFLSTIEDEV